MRLPKVTHRATRGAEVDCGLGREERIERTARAAVRDLGTRALEVQVGVVRRGPDGLVQDGQRLPRKVVGPGCSSPVYHL